MFISEAFAQQAAATIEKTIVEQPGFFHLLSHADPIVKLTLFILLFFSVMSWAIIAFKYIQLKKAKSHVTSFWASFTQARSLEDFFKSRYERGGPLYEIFNAVVLLVPRLQKGSKTKDFLKATVETKINQAREEEIFKLEQYTSFLATTASTAPFVGLFGTVWGILMAFQIIGKAGSSSLDTVGPFISEALVATAVGLAAAIPAVVAYNFFVSRIKNIIKMMDLFIDELTLKVEEEVLS